MNDDFILWEDRVMRSLGLGDRDDIRSMREELLVENQDWARVGHRVMLTRAAAEKLAAHLNVFPSRLAAIQSVRKSKGCLDTAVPEKTPPGPCPELPAPEKPPPEPHPESEVPVQRLAVLSQRPLNPHIILCRPVDADPSDRDAWLNVRVKTNANFRPSPAETGEILARPIAGKLWEFAGNPKSQKNDVPRCPRWPGKW